MKVIALTSATNNGKTNTLKLVYNLLLLDGFQQEPSSFWVMGKQDRLSSDIRAIFLWNGVKVGLITRGDVSRRLEDDLRHLESQGCKLTICASRKWKRWSVKGIYPSTLVVPKTKRTSLVAMYAANGSDANQLRDLVKTELSRIMLG